MKIARLVKNADGGFSWFGRWRWKSEEHEVTRIELVDGFWRICWSDMIPAALPLEFQSADDACLAAEKCWRSEYPDEGVWIESKTGGYFRKSKTGNYYRKSRKKLILYLRQLGQHWYVVRDDGMVLGKADKPSWFATAEDASRAVEQEFYTPVDADPFRDTSDRWCWIRPKGKRAA
jgi:hypothetical protein